MQGIPEKSTARKIISNLSRLPKIDDKCVNFSNKKEEIMQRISENGTLSELLLMYQQMALQFATKLDPKLGEQVANQILSQSGQPIPQQMVAESTGVGDANKDGKKEHAFVEKARKNARASTEVE